MSEYVFSRYVLFTTGQRIFLLIIVAARPDGEGLVGAIIGYLDWPARQAKGPQIHILLAVASMSSLYPFERYNSSYGYR